MIAVPVNHSAPKNVTCFSLNFSIRHRQGESTVKRRSWKDAVFSAAAADLVFAMRRSFSIRIPFCFKQEQ